MSGYSKNTPDHNMDIFGWCVCCACISVVFHTQNGGLIVSPDESRGYLGLSMVTPQRLPLQRFPF